MTTGLENISRQMGHTSCFSRASMRTPAVHTRGRGRRLEETPETLPSLRLFLDGDVSCYRGNMPLYAKGHVGTRQAETVVGEGLKETEQRKQRCCGAPAGVSRRSTFSVSCSVRSSRKQAFL